MFSEDTYFIVTVLHLVEAQQICWWELIIGRTFRILDSGSQGVKISNTTLTLIKILEDSLTHQTRAMSIQNSRQNNFLENQNLTLPN